MIDQAQIMLQLLQSSRMFEDKNGLNSCKLWIYNWDQGPDFWFWTQNFMWKRSTKFSLLEPL